MDSSLIAALVVPWIFWGILMGLLIVARRSWINMLLIPAAMTIIILFIAGLASEQAALWTSLVVHLLLLILFVSSYVMFVYKNRSK